MHLFNGDRPIVHWQKTGKYGNSSQVGTPEKYFMLHSCGVFHDREVLLQKFCKAVFSPIVGWCCRQEVGWLWDGWVGGKGVLVGGGEDIAAGQ